MPRRTVDQLRDGTELDDVYLVTDKGAKLVGLTSRAMQLASRMTEPDYGRILVGIQVPAEDSAAFDAFLATIGHPYAEETNNPAYRLFLQTK